MSASHRRIRAFSGAVLLMVLAAYPAGALEYSLEERLAVAVNQGDLPAIQALLKAGVDVNYQPQHGTSALTAAARKGDLAVVKALLAAKADANIGKKSGTTPLNSAAGGNRWEIVLALLAGNADPDGGDSSGYTPLFLAASAGRMDVVQALVAAGADPSPRVKAGGGRSALVWVLMSGNLDMALLLVKSGADGNEATDYQETPLRLASSGNTPKHLELVRALLATGVYTETGQVPRYKFDVACNPIDGRIGCFNIRTAEGTALGIAAGSGSVEIVQALLAAKADVNARQTGWLTPLMLAAMGNRADVVRLLLAAGADPNAKDSSDRTALMLAEEKGSQEVVNILRNATIPAKN